MAASRDGRCSAVSTLIPAASAYSGHTAGCGRIALPARPAASRPSPASHQRSSRRRSSRSASTPPYRPNTTSGTSSATPSRPTAKADPVSCLAWTSRATPVAWVPNNVTLRLAYSIRKLAAPLPRSGETSIRSRLRLIQRVSPVGCPHANTQVRPASPHFSAPPTGRPRAASALSWSWLAPCSAGCCGGKPGRLPGCRPWLAAIWRSRAISWLRSAAVRPALIRCSCSALTARTRSSAARPCSVR